MNRISSYISGFFIATLAVLTAGNHAFAQDIGTISENMVDSVAYMPGLLAALSYLFGLVLGVTGILKLKAHVENPGEGGGQTPLRTGMIRLIAAGSLFALPIIYEALFETMDGGFLATFFGVDPLNSSSASQTLAGVTGTSTGNNFNSVLDNIIQSLSTTPGLIAAFAYLLGLLIGVMGIIKAKEHVENPEQIKLSEAVIRLLTASALLAIPTLYNAMFSTVDGSGLGIVSGVSAWLSGGSVYFSEYADSTCGGGGSSTGSLICGVISNTGVFPAFLSAISYLFGLVIGFWGILKIRDHVLNPQQTQIWEGVSRFIAAGAFFALPAVVFVMYNTLAGGNISAGDATGFNQGTAPAGSCPSSAGLGLDGMLACFVNDIFGPLHSVLSFFAFVAGMVFIMIGISRLLKSAQEGAKGPGGIGTIMTFIMGGALISYNELMGAATTSFTGDATTKAYATLQYTTGMSGSEVGAAHAVITAVIKFMIVVGLISFVRGLFIVRSVAEGNQQASMMAAVTHIVGGALAVNLGPLLNAVQETLGLTNYGITFS